MRLFLKILDCNPDIVHIFTPTMWGYWRNVIYMLIVKAANRKVIFHILGAIDIYSRQSNLAVKFLIRKSLDVADLYIVQSDGLKRFLTCLSKRCVKTIVNGIDFQRFEAKRTVDKSKYNLPKEAHIIITIGKLSRAKGTLDIIKAAETVLEIFSNAYFFFVGHGDIEKFKRACKEVILDKVRFLGAVSEEAKIDLLNSSDIFVLPSYAEGMPISILEAMAIGLPIVSTKVGAIPEVVKENNGILIESGDIAALGSAIGNLLKDELLRRRIGENNRLEIQTKYTLKRMAQDLDTIYTGLISYCPKRHKIFGLKQIYNNMPIPFQNAMVSIYGWQLKRLKFGGSYSKYREEVERYQWLSSEELNEIQTQRLRAIIDYAYRYVPFYRAVFDERNIRSSDIKTKDDLTKLPVISKQIIRASPGKFLSKNINCKQVVVDHTSGTTGSSLTVYMDLGGFKKNQAYMGRFKSWAGIGEDEPFASFGVRMVVSPKQMKPPFWRYNSAAKQLYFSIYHMNERNLYYYIDALNKFRPSYIVAFPSAVYTIAKFAKKADLKIVTIKALFTTAETLLDYQREVIEEVFGCKVFDQYGNVECVSFASECERSNMHLDPTYGIVEFIKDGKPVVKGEAGEMICTGLINLAMPLIRYRIGDMAALSDSICSCGRKLPVLEKLIGRTEDIIVTPDGKFIARFDPVFKELDNIIESQIIQESVDSLLVKVVSSEYYNESDTKTLLYELKRRVGDEMHIKIEFVNNIPRESSGKFRAVVSKIAKSK